MLELPVDDKVTVNSQVPAGDEGEADEARRNLLSGRTAASGLVIPLPEEDSDEEMPAVSEEQAYLFI
jgi:hypothetical protein